MRHPPAKTEVDLKRTSAEAELDAFSCCTDKVGRILKKHNIESILKSIREVGQMSPSAKVNISLLIPGIYKAAASERLC